MSLSDKLIELMRRVARNVGFARFVSPEIATFPQRDPIIHNDLSRLIYTHDGHIVHKWDHYLDVYDKCFSKFRRTNFKFLEIGISHGGSLEVWRKYFGPKATIFDIDINCLYRPAVVDKCSHRIANRPVVF
jgi:hypothetical protein